jgi:hypothetical protein
MAAWIIVMEFIDIQWCVLPNLHPEGYEFTWLDASCLLGVFGMFAAGIARSLGRVSLIPVQDPLLVRSLEFENV